MAARLKLQDRRSSAPALRSPSSQARRRRAGSALAGLVMVAVALVFYAGLRGGSAPVLAVARQVPAGQVLVAEDLKVVDVELGDGVASIPAAQLAEVTGRVASGPLVPGQLLVAGSVTAGPVVGPGEALIGLVLTPGRYPPGLKEGDRYQLVDLSVAPGGAAPLGRVVAVRPSESAWV